MQNKYIDTSKAIQVALETKEQSAVLTANKAVAHLKALGWRAEPIADEWVAWHTFVDNLDESEQQALKFLTDTDTDVAIEFVKHGHHFIDPSSDTGKV